MNFVTTTMSFASASPQYLMLFLSIRTSSNCLSSPFVEPKVTCLSGMFLYMVLSATKCRIISHCFIQSPRLFNSSSVYGSTPRRSAPTPGRGACAFLCLPRSGKLDIDWYPTIQCRIAFFCAQPQPPSKKIFLPTLRCFSVQFSLTFFRKRAIPGSSHASLFQPFIPVLGCPFLPLHRTRPLHQHLFNIFRTREPHVILISSQNINVWHCGHLIPRSRVAHITPPAGPLTCFHV